MTTQTSPEIPVQTLDQLLAASAATPAFQTAVRALAEGRPQGLVQFSRSNPAVKVLRLTMKLLEQYPEFPFESMKVDGQAGCSDYIGSAMAEPGGARFEFTWDCHWRAESLGWVDAFGDVDQGRAARTLGYQCFRRMERV